MTPPERERTLRVLSARNRYVHRHCLARVLVVHSVLTTSMMPRLRLANEETKQRTEAMPNSTVGSTDARLSILNADAPAS